MVFYEWMMSVYAKGRYKMDATKILQLLGALNTVIPNLMDIIMHYKTLSVSPELNETDKKQMKENLDRLKLPSWDSL